MINVPSVLSVGLPVFLEKIGDTQHIKYKAKLLGWFEKSFLLVSLPAINGTALKIQDATRCNLKFISNGNVYACETTVLKTQYQPIPILFLKFPYEVENVSLRNCERMQANIRCAMYPFISQTITMDSVEENNPFDSDDIFRTEKDEKSDNPDNGIIVDISPEGCLLQVTDENRMAGIIVGSKAGLQFKLPDGSEIKGLVADIRNIKMDMGKKMVGIQFINTNEIPFEMLTNFFKKYYGAE